MADIGLSTRISAPIAPDNAQRLRDPQREPQRGHGVDPRGHGAAPEATPAPQASLLVLPILAPEVLIAIQQARPLSRDQSPDENPDATSESPQQGTENKSKSADEAEQSAGQSEGAGEAQNVVPLFANDTFSAPQSTIAPPTPAFLEQPSTASVSADNGERSAFNRANQAYVTAGAEDGRTFGAAVFEPVSVNTTQAPINLVI